MKSNRLINNNFSGKGRYIIHIPHSSLEIPFWFKKRLLFDDSYFNKENKFISDYKIDNFIPKDFSNIVRFNYSRLFCDVERYLDDSKEEMAKIGMGALYRKDSNGNNFVSRIAEENKYIIKNYYIPHHKKLDEMVENVLSIYNDCFIIDLHSFSDELVKRIINKRDCPDICIGINDNYDINILVKTINYFKKQGYSVRVNYPYSGSIISNKYPNVKSMMIEVNKRIYLNSKIQYNDFYKCMLEYYDMLFNCK